MSLDRASREELVRALAEAVIQHADELTGLDQDSCCDPPAGRVEEQRLVEAK